MIVIAVENFNVDACLRHPACDFAELTWFRLVQPLNQHVALGKDPDACRPRALCGRRSHR